MTDMTNLTDLTNEKIGELVSDYYHNEARKAQLRAQLAQTGENMALLGDILKTQPDTLALDQASILLRDSQGQNRTLPLTALDPDAICKTIREFQQSVELETQIEHELTQGGLGRLARTLKNQAPQNTTS